MNRIVLISGIVASIGIFNIAICDDQPCPGTPSRCYPTGQSTSAQTCVNVFLNGSGSTWNEMQRACQNGGGRLVWLRSDFNITNLFFLNPRAHEGSFLVLGLLSSTVDQVGQFWKSPDNTSYQCTSTETSECLSSSNEGNCSAVGCCWRNNKCQYPNIQNLTVFNQSVENYNLSTSDHRECVGYQLNNNSKTERHWINYDCFKTLSNAVYFCEYKCNTNQWKNTTITEFTFMGKNNNTNYTTSTEKTNMKSTNSISTSYTTLTEKTNIKSTNSISTSYTTLTEKTNIKSTNSISTSNKTPTEKPKENGMNLESTSSRLINMLLSFGLLIVVM